MCRRVTLPSGSNASRRGASASSRRGATPTLAATAAIFSRSRRVTIVSMTPRSGGRLGAHLARRGRTPWSSVTNAGDAQWLADVERGQIELELRVLDGIGGQHVAPQRGHAPLHPLAHVPGFAAVRAPCRKMAGEAIVDVGQEASAQELAGAAFRRMAIGAGVVP